MRYAAAALALSMLCSVELLELHGPDGQRVWVNTAEISSLRMPTNADLARHFPRNTHCVVVTGNGKFITTVETCAAIRDRLAR